MAKTRLNMNHRDVLRQFAKENISCPKEEAANAKAYEKASRLVREESQKKYPLEDMLVLEKYEVAKRDLCINGGNPTGTYVNFEFLAEADAPLMPKRYCSSRSISFSQKAADAIAAYELTKDALEKARSAKLIKYRSLIETARYFEDVIEVWPAVASLASRITPSATALVTLSDDVREFIKSDNAGEKLAA